ncbi:MAG TPA: hypothetical protein VGH71_04970, partial [Gammaproteobacteria bacterium]
QLMETLRENCGIAEPRLTLIACATTEGDEGSYWHGRFATFHSVMMLRGRERWLQATRSLMASALQEVGAEIERELKKSAPGLRHARLRLGLKDLEGLRIRFHELGRLEGEPAAELASASSTGDVPAPPFQWQPLATQSAAPTQRPAAFVMDAGEEAWLSEQEARELLEEQALRAPRGIQARLGRLISFARLPFSPARTAASVHVDSRVKGSSRPWRLLGGVWAAAFLGILLWVMWPRLAAEHESAAEWDLRQPSAAPAPKAALASPEQPAPSLVAPALHAETEQAGVRDTVPPPSRNHRQAVIRTPLVKPVPQGLRAGAAPIRRHRSFLGLSKVWGWVRHPRGSTHSSSTTPATNNE